MLVNDHWIAGLWSATLCLGGVQKAVYDVVAWQVIRIVEEP